MENKKEQIIYVQRGGFLGGIVSMIGRIMISLFFVATSVMSALKFKEYASSFEQLGLPMPVIIAVVSIGLQIIVAFLFTGLIPIPLDVLIGKIMLLVVTVGTTIFKHNPIKDMEQLPNALRNVAIAGGLLLG